MRRAAAKKVGSRLASLFHGRSTGLFAAFLVAIVFGSTWTGSARTAAARHPGYRVPVYRAPIYRAPGWAVAPRVVAPRVVVPRNYGISYWGSAYHRAPAYVRAARVPAANYYASRYGGFYGGYYGGYYGVHHRHVYRYPATYYYGFYPTYPSYYVSPFCDPIGLDPWWGAAPWGWLGANNAAFDADLAPAVAPAAVPAQNGLVANRAPAAAAPAAPRAVAARPPQPAADDPFAQGRLVQIGGEGGEQRPIRALLARVPGMVTQATQGGTIDAGTIRQVVNEVAAARNAARPASPATADSSLDDRRRAGKYVEQGDELFGRGRYLEAMSIYRKAANAAQDMAQPWFRQGFAFLAAGRYERSVEAFREGLQRDPSYFESGFRLNQLYGGDEGAKERHIESLAQAALDDESNSDLAYLVGVFLHFDGQPDRANPFFDRAERLAAERTTATRGEPVQP